MYYYYYVGDDVEGEDGNDDAMMDGDEDANTNNNTNKHSKSHTASERNNNQHIDINKPHENQENIPQHNLAHNNNINSNMTGDTSLGSALGLFRGQRAAVPPLPPSCAATTPITVPQIYMNEDSMDVHTMQIELSSHSHSFPVGVGVTGTGTGTHSSAASYYM